MLKFFERVSKNIDDLTVKAGRISSWIILFMILAQFTWLILKNIFGIKLIAFFELNMLSLGLLVMASCSHNLLSNKHLKLDGFIKKASQQKQAAINMIGALFFVIPTAALIFGLTWSYFLNELHQHQFQFSLEAFTDPSSLRIMSLSAFISVTIIFTQLTALAAISLACKAALTLHQLKSENFEKILNESRGE
ncbi:hypothetical protein NBRC116602_19760 [Hyphomicrobiales bacterium 4NK60-0047b]